MARCSVCWVAAVVLAALAGCTVGPNYVPPKPSLSHNYAEAQSIATIVTNPVPSRVLEGAAPINQWWRTFHDPDLDRLIDEALAQNLDLKVAMERIRQARAQRRSVAAGLLPQIDADAGYNRARGSKNVVLPLGSGGGSGTGSTGSSTPPRAASKADPPGDPPPGNNSSSPSGGTPSGNLLTPFGKGGLPGVTTELYQAGFDSMWELDVFGGTRRQVEAASADIQAAIENRRDLMVTLLAEVARNYLELRGTQQLQGVALENLAAQRQVLELTQSLRKSGLVSELDVARAASQVATTEASIPPLEASVRQSIHSLSTLLAKEPTALDTDLDHLKPWAALPPQVPVGLPSDLLLRRPDIRRAERQIHAATARVGSAKADWFPKFALTGSVGFDSSSVRHLLDWQSHYFLISPTVTWPIFDAGRIAANVRVQESVRDQSVLEYRSAILAALREVEDSLVAYATEQQRRVALADALRESRRALEISRDQYQHGLVDFLTVLDAQRSVLSAQESLTRSDQTAATDLVALYKALGGGWAIDSSNGAPKTK